jgi:hypothetical protein
MEIVVRKAFAAAFAVLVLASISAGPSLANTFGDYECGETCTQHAAGFRWAQQNDILVADDCPTVSQAFYEGCVVYTKTPDRGADKDDQGEPII